MDRRCTVILEPVSKRVEVQAGSTIYDAMLALEHPVGALCGGAGTCGKCKVLVASSESSLAPPTSREKEHLGQAIDEGYRLACQARVTGDCRVRLPDTLLPGGNRILTRSDEQVLGITFDAPVEPCVATTVVQIASPSIEDPVADLSRVIDALASRGVRVDWTVDGVVLAAIRDIPAALRQGNGIATAFTGMPGRANRIVDVVPGDRHGEAFGLAIDIGTTTVVGYLVDAVTGVERAIHALLNPQVAIGEDVVSRITHVARKGALHQANKLVIDGINEIITEVARKGKIDQREIRDVVFVGNTAMHHLFLGVDPCNLAVSPFAPAFKAPVNVPAASLGLACHPNANVYSPPVVAGYVGTDTVACVVASRIDQAAPLTLLIDIGTNGELVLGNKDGLVAGSCAAGPALEGAAIGAGMRAAEGAIEGVRIDPSTLGPSSLNVIGNVHPVGICGSGLVDVVAEMLKTGILTRSGRFNTRSPAVAGSDRIQERDGDLRYVLFDPARDTGAIAGFSGDEGRPARDATIAITQEDVRQVQLAKGAFLSGALLLLEATGKQPADIERVVLAGAFGSYITKENAAFIGLFPEVDPASIFQIGNAAGTGARQCAVNAAARDLADAISGRMRYTEISASPRFQAEYARALYFPHHDLGLFPRGRTRYEAIPLR